MKILIFGLPGSGKTTLAKPFANLIGAVHINADVVRKKYDDWDFSPEGRIRQSMRMRTFADFEKSNNRIVICDFVCPTNNTQGNFDPDIVIWMDTIQEGRFDDTNKMFEKPLSVDFHMTELNDNNHINISKELLKNV